MDTRRIAAAATIVALFGVTETTTGDEKLSLKVTPNVSSAPSTVVVRAIVAPHADNRRLHIEADSGAFLRSSDVQLDGDKAPTVTEIRLKNLPSGEYTVKAVLIDAAGTSTVASRTALVLARFGEQP